MDIQSILFQFLGGLGIFLFGLKYMGDGLQRAAGDNLREILNRFTSTPLRAVLAGIVVTAMIQSSTGTTVLTVGLVSAGFMKLKQAIGVIMGANIGTTVTAFIIGLNIGAYALPIIAVGALLLFFFKKAFINSLGQVVFGFGALFYGLELVGDGLAPLQELEAFSEAMVSLSDSPFLGVIAGTVITFILQSSSATTGILQGLFAQGAMTIEAAIPILIGSNIGTTVTAILAAIGASVAAKRTAASHVIFNLVGTILVFVVLTPFTNTLIWLTDMFNLNPEMQIAFGHGLFNIVNVLIQMWFIKYIAAIVTRIVPGEDEFIDYDTSRLDHSIIKAAPSIALNQSKLEIKEMGEFVLKGYKETFKYYSTQDKEPYEKANQFEEVINKVDMSLTEYLMLISVEDLPIQYATEHTQMMEITKYLERIGDHCQSILENMEEAISAAKKQSNDSDEKVFYDEDLINLFNLVEQNVQDAIYSFTDNSYNLAGRVLKREKEVDRLENNLRYKYIERLNEGVGKPSDGILFVDIVSNLERISDHSEKIAKHSLGIRYPFQSQRKTPRHGYRKEAAEESS